MEELYTKEDGPRKASTQYEIDVLQKPDYEPNIFNIISIIYSYLQRYGVMQGGVLSPKLFNELLQDLGKYLNPKYGLKIGDIYLAYLLFADDIVIFSEFAESLQTQIDLFYKYCEIWNLIISIAKTKIVIYNQIYAKHSFSFTLAENTLEIVQL